MNYGPHYRFPIYNSIGKIFDVVFYFGDKLPEKIKSIDYQTLPSFGGLVENKYWKRFYWQKGANSIARSNEYGRIVMVGDVYCISNWFILLLAKFTSKKTVLWTHGLYGNESFFKKFIKKLLYSLCDQILVYSEYSIHNMVREGITIQKMFCIANSLDSIREKSIRESLCTSSVYSTFFGNAYPTIIYCGRIQKRKRLDLLIESIYILQKKNIGVNLVIVGKDDENVGLERLVNERGLVKSVWFYGPCYDDQKLAELFYNACVCVSPGNVGLTAIHSLTFGCPVITHDDFCMQMPEFEAIQQGVTGSFFHNGDINSLVDTIQLWLKNDDLEREKIRNSAYKEIDRKWNVDYQIEVLNKILDKK